MPRIVAKKKDEPRELDKVKHYDRYSSPSEQGSDDDIENRGPEPSKRKAAPKNGKKRPFAASSGDIDEADNEPPNVTNEMHKLLEGFGVDIEKNLVAKRKRLQQFTQASLRSSVKRVDDFLKRQHIERQKLNTEFCRQLGSVLDQWDADLAKAKENEEKLQKLILQQQKAAQQNHHLQAQRIKALRLLQEQYLKGAESLQAEHERNQASIENELKKELSALQKKILMDTQQQEMANVRKSLQSMLF